MFPSQTIVFMYVYLPSIASPFDVSYDRAPQTIRLISTSSTYFDTENTINKIEYTVQSRDGTPTYTCTERTYVQSNTHGGKDIVCLIIASAETDLTSRDHITFQYYVVGTAEPYGISSEFIAVDPDVDFVTKTYGFYFQTNTFKSTFDEISVNDDVTFLYGTDGQTYDRSCDDFVFDIGSDRIPYMTCTINSMTFAEDTKIYFAIKYASNDELIPLTYPGYWDVLLTIFAIEGYSTGIIATGETQNLYGTGNIISYIIYIGHCIAFHKHMKHVTCLMSRVIPLHSTSIISFFLFLPLQCVPFLHVSFLYVVSRRAVFCWFVMCSNR